MEPVFGYFEADHASMFPLAGLWINNLYGLAGIHELSPYIGIPLTILMTVFIINAINLIDGIDGLASGLSIDNDRSFEIRMYLRIDCCIRDHKKCQHIT